ncbi:hypothetical protein ATANTOWER_001913 [Ataeniobius toweri]|uniref:Uncharacterized protein n=1 Tax=Ataeniobius toweri TaxID=208326 RepID=A0ABU7CHQ5_9TELE|nr:hypothetical protein [Ataeniobius toweri]
MTVCLAKIRQRLVGKSQSSCQLFSYSNKTKLLLKRLFYFCSKNVLKKVLRQQSTLTVCKLILILMFHIGYTYNRAQLLEHSGKANVFQRGGSWKQIQTLPHCRCGQGTRLEKVVLAVKPCLFVFSIYTTYQSEERGK